MITKKSILAGAALSCLLLLTTTTPISADRAGASIDWNDSEDEAALTPLPLISLEKKKKFTHPDSPKNKKYVLDGHVSAEGKVLIKPKNKSRGSLFVRSFLLAAVFWAVKFILPQIIRYWSERHRQVVSSRGRGRKRGKTRGHYYDEEDLSTVVTTDTDQTISPSVMELLELGNDFGDDGASFITAGTMGTTGTFATYLSSLVSKYRSRGRADKNPLARFNPPSASRKSKSSSAAENTNQSHHDQHQQSSSTKHHHKSKQLDLSKISKRHSFKGLHFIDEDNANDNNSDDIIKGNQSSSRQQHKGSKERISYNLDDASQLPSMGGKKDHRYSNSQHKNNDPSSPLERKLSAGVSQDSDHNHTRGKEKHHHRSQHHHHRNEGRHRHRDGTK